MLNKKEKGQIIRYCLYPEIAGRALAISFILPLLMLPLQTIDSLFLHNKSKSFIGIYTTLDLAAVYLLIFCYCSLAPKFGMLGKQWKSIISRKAKDGGVFDISDHANALMDDLETPVHLHKPEKHVGRTAEAMAGILSKMQAIPETVAKVYGVTIPNIKKYLIAFMLLPILIQIGVYIPQYIQAGRELRERVAHASEQISIVAQALQPVCEHVIASDPNKNYSEYGYHVIGDLRWGELNEDIQESDVFIQFTEEGDIESVSYNFEIDPSVSLEENLTRVEKEFEILNEPLTTLQLSAIAPGMLGKYTLSQEFRDTFLSGSFEEDIYLPTEVNGLRVISFFYGVGEDQSTSDTEPRISFSIKKAQ